MHPAAGEQRGPLTPEDPGPWVQPCCQASFGSQTLPFAAQEARQGLGPATSRKPGVYERQAPPTRAGGEEPRPWSESGRQGPSPRVGHVGRARLCAGALRAGLLQAWVWGRRQSGEGTWGLLCSAEPSASGVAAWGASQALSPGGRGCPGPCGSVPMVGLGSERQKSVSGLLVHGRLRRLSGLGW